VARTAGEETESSALTVGAVAHTAGEETESSALTVGAVARNAGTLACSVKGTCC